MSYSRPSTNFDSNTGTGGCATDYVRIPNGSNIVGGDCTVPPAGAPTTSPTIDRYKLLHKDGKREL